MRTYKEVLSIAALLHDIGKLGWRAGEKGPHQEIGANFLQKVSEDLFSDVSSLVSMHHNDSQEGFFNQEGYMKLKLLIIADWLASTERIGKQEKVKVREIGLTPIFSKIAIYTSKMHEHQEYSYTARQLTFQNNCNEIFPIPKERVKDEIQANFVNNWNGFKEKFKEYVTIEDAKLRFEFLFSLLKTHFKFVPSAAYFVEPDISLFDHSKMVCAFSVALYNFFAKNHVLEETIVKQLNIMGNLLEELYRKGEQNLKNDSTKMKILQETKNFSLIHGDFSGIQEFIHSVSSKHAMKTLKGRSFFLSMLTEAIARYAVEQLDLTIANIIYAGGGHFYIISQNSENLNTQLREISMKANALFLERFHTTLYLALDHLPLSLEDIAFSDKLSTIWQRVNLKTSMIKRKKFHELLFASESNYTTTIFGPIIGSATSTERCVVCNSFKKLEPISDEINDLKWCSQCSSFRDLTDSLRDAKYFRFTTHDSKDYNQMLNEFQQALELSPMLKGHGWYAINDPTQKDTMGNVSLPIAFPMYSKDSQKFGILENDTMAQEAFLRTGYNKIGILKMDVDSLGKIISLGLGAKSTISRVSTLSTSLDLFFKGYIAKLIHDSYPDSLYLIFSGGDDVFAIGAWDHLIEFSFMLYKKFRTYTAFNPDITISAGIAIYNPNFPIFQGVKVAEKALEDAKQYDVLSKTRNTKNKISLFGSTLSWDWSLKKEEHIQTLKNEGISFKNDCRTRIKKLMKIEDESRLKEEMMTWVDSLSEFELAEILKDILVYLIQEKDYPRGILQKIANSVKGMKPLLMKSVTGKIDVPKLWRLQYYLRAILSSKDSETKLLGKFIVMLYEIVIKNNIFKQDLRLQVRNVEFISVAVRWADYLTRK